MGDTEKAPEAVVIKITYRDGSTYAIETDAFVLAASPKDESGVKTVIYGSGWDTAALWKVADAHITERIVQSADREN
jgi:hypothetical protein